MKGDTGGELIKQSGARHRSGTDEGDTGVELIKEIPEGELMKQGGARYRGGTDEEIPEWN